MTNYLKIQSYHNLTFKEKAEVIVSISKPENFYLTFFNNLPHARTRVECFNHLNDLHFDIYGFYMYSDYASFNNCYSRHLKNRRK